MNTLTKLALRAGIIYLVAGGTVHAQFAAEPDPGETEDVRRYTVELIIFEYAEEVGLGGEVFVPEPIDPEAEIDFESPEEPVDAEEDGENVDDEPADIELGILTLQPDELTMTETLARLERLDAYRPLMHFGWTQATVPAEISPALPLARFGSPPPGLDGDLKLYLNRFLHLVVNVSKLAPGSNIPASASRSGFDAAVQPHDSAYERDTFGRTIEIERYEPLRYRINEDRIMKNGETRYYDHPKIGVIAKVTRVEEEDGASAGF